VADHLAVLPGADCVRLSVVRRSTHTRLPRRAGALLQAAGIGEQQVVARSPHNRSVIQGSSGRRAGGRPARLEFAARGMRVSGSHQGCCRVTSRSSRTRHDRFDARQFSQTATVARIDPLSRSLRPGSSSWRGRFGHARRRPITVVPLHRNWRRTPRRPLRWPSERRWGEKELASM